MQQLQLILTGNTIEELVDIAADFVAKNSVEKAPRKTRTKTQPVVEQTIEAPEQTIEAPEQTTNAPNTPQNATDLMAGVMPLVAGDSGKKIKLVKLLESFNAKTINTLAAEHYAEFWSKAQEL